MILAGYELAEAAARDLEGIALYTISKWGSKQALRYVALLSSHFDAIGNGKARTRIFLQHRPELHVSRVQHHYVFHLSRVKDRPLILAVLHERMDLMSRLRERLSE